jgi:hypothetical protein
LKAATYNPAKFLGLLGSLGTVEANKLADLVLLDANPLDDITNTTKINMVFTAGRVSRRSALDAMLRAVEMNAKNIFMPSPEVLSKYVGNYESVESKRPWRVTLADGVLMLSVGDEQGRAPLVPISETAFVGRGGRIEFPMDDKGEVNHLVYRFNEKEFPANRKN